MNNVDLLLSCSHQTAVGNDVDQFIVSWILSINMTIDQLKIR